MVIMNMQNELYIIQFFSPSNNRFSAQKKCLKSQPREDSKLLENRKAGIFLPTSQPLRKLIMTTMVWNISIGQLWLAVWLFSLPAPAHLFMT